MEENEAIMHLNDGGHICGRCCKVYREGDDRRNVRIGLDVYYEDAVPKIHEGFNVCPDCEKSFMKWLRRQ